MANEEKNDRRVMTRSFIGIQEFNLAQEVQQFLYLLALAHISIQLRAHGKQSENILFITLKPTNQICYCYFGQDTRAQASSWCV